MRKNLKIHFIGIGGAGMLPLAIHAKELGHTVTGSDLSDETFRLLISEGIVPKKGHTSVPEGTDLVVYSSAVRNDNPEMIDSKSKYIACVKRAEFLGMITRSSHSILVAGCHGKSTTSVMLADMLNKLQPYNASAIIGAESVGSGSNYYRGSTEYVVIEADEYDRSFLKLYPKDLLILNIDDDHLDIYGDIEGIKNGFKELAEKLSPDSILIFNGDDENVREIVKTSAGKKVSFGLNGENDYTAKNIRFTGFRTSFELFKGKTFITGVEYFYTGLHNVFNMLAAASLMSEYGVSPETISESAKRFMGLKRRQEIIFQNENYILMDEYGHHPTEIKCSVDGIRENYKKRIIVIFQPHLFSRTKQHSKGFAKSFTNADLVLISQIYPARENQDTSVTSMLIYEAMDEKEKAKTKIFLNFEELYLELKKVMKPGDLILSMGAGEINKLLYKLKDEIK